MASFDDEYHQHLEETIKLCHLEELMHRFVNHRPRSAVARLRTSEMLSVKKKLKQGFMVLDEFRKTISDILQNNDYDEYLIKLFNKIDIKCQGHINWDDFCTYMMLMYRENDYARTRAYVPFTAEPKIRHIIFNRQEASCKVLAIMNPTRYLTVSKEGCVTVWDSLLRPEKMFLVSECSDKRVPKRRVRMWVTDMTHMDDCNKLVVSSTSREIHFFDITSNYFSHEFCIYSLPDIPLCLAYWSDKTNPHSTSLLVCGDDSGHINLYYFLKPLIQLFATPPKKNENVQRIFFQDLKNHCEYVTLSCILKVHPDMVCQVKYIHQNNCIVSASSSQKASIVITDIDNLQRPYIFRQEKGVECFDYSKHWNIVVTGCSDCIIRVWNIFVTHKPIGILSSHCSAVIAIAIHEDLCLIFSYSQDAVIKVWDLKEYTCLQTICVKFPTSPNDNKPEHGQFPMFMHLQSTPCLLVTCNDYLGQLKLGHYEPMRDMVVTHDSSLCCAIYNSPYKQVITGCDTSSVIVWDVETGNKCLMMSNAHNGDEITAMSIDGTFRRLLTGARNGSIKIWNVQNGQNLHRLEAIGHTEVTGLVHLVDKRAILAVGWNRKIVQYDDTQPENVYLKSMSTWKGGYLHQEDILCMDVCFPNLLATGSFNGEIILWTLDTEQLFIRLTNPKRPSRNLSSRGSRPNSRHRTCHKHKKGEAAPIDKLIFLKHRASVKNFEGGILISSEAGCLRWWSIFGKSQELCIFSACDNDDECVLALCSCEKDHHLITGDTQGWIKIWNICQYAMDTSAQDNVKPDLIRVWQAHDKTVVSVEYVNHECGEFILSASSDQTARLWSITGQLVGTFGQKKEWILKDPSTWTHKERPSVNGNHYNYDHEKLPELNEDKLSPDFDSEIQTIEREESFTERNENIHLSLRFSESGSNTKPRHSLTLRRSSYVPCDVIDSLKVAGRSQTFTLGSRLRSSQTFLGSRVSEHLLRKQLGRQERRDHFSDLRDKGLVLSHSSSPFHALSTMVMKDESLPKNLPLSRRMMSRGYTSHNLTTDQLRGMNFSILPDTPSTSHRRNIIPYINTDVNI